MAIEGEANQKLLKKPVSLEEGDGGEDEPLKDRIWSETKKMWIVAAPAIFTRLSTFGIYVISQAFIGHIGSTELAAYSLVFTVLLRFANGVLLGMASALETLCGQAYGAKQYHMLGVYLQRSWIVLTLCAIFLVPLFIFTAPLLKALGQEDKIAKVAGEISLGLIPILFAFVISFTCQMFLQAQSKNMFIAYIAAFSAVVHLCLSWLLTAKYQFGILGAMASTILAYWIPNIGQLMFVLCGGCRDTWKGFSSSAFKDLRPVIKLSLSSGAMLWGRLAYIFTESDEVANAVADLSPLLSISILLNSVQPVLSGVAVGAGWQSIVAYVNIISYYLVGIPVGGALAYFLGMQVKGMWVGMLFGTFVQTVVLIVITYKNDWDKQVLLARTQINKWFMAEEGSHKARTGV
ncbi:hypothetical protein BT93_F0791 [Corymbia citriodora subsp. variegata]|nr:hypothetical protein BT93_F0791 [Corymbia citriodora subsp. variegata]